MTTSTSASAQAPLSVREAIETRRSIRKYVQEPMNQDDLREILRLASLAPSAWNAQTWRFAVVQDPAIKEQLKEAAYGQGQVTSAPVVVVVYSDMEDTLQTVEETAHPGMGEAGGAGQRATFDRVFGAQEVAQRGQWGLSQANIAFGFLMLAARSMGYDTVPMLGFQPDKVKEILGLPQHVEFAGLLPLGRRAEEGYPHHRHSLDRITRFY